MTKKKLIAFEETGETRLPRKWENYLDFDGRVCIATYDWENTKVAVPIFRPLDPADLVPVAELAEVRKAKADGDAKFIADLDRVCAEVLRLSTALSAAESKLAEVERAHDDMTDQCEAHILTIGDLRAQALAAEARCAELAGALKFVERHVPVGAPLDVLRNALLSQPPAGKAEPVRASLPIGDGPAPGDDFLDQIVDECTDYDRAVKQDPAGARTRLLDKIRADYFGKAESMGRIPAVEALLKRHPAPIRLEGDGEALGWRDANGVEVDEGNDYGVHEAGFAAINAYATSRPPAEAKPKCATCGGKGIVAIGDGYSVDGCPKCEPVTEPDPRVEVEALRELVRHCWVHSGYPDCGRREMTTAQKALYDEIVGRKPEWDVAEAKQTIAGIPVVVDPSMPPGVMEARMGGKVVGRVTGLAPNPPGIPDGSDAGASGDGEEIWAVLASDGESQEWADDEAEAHRLAAVFDESQPGRAPHRPARYRELRPDHDARLRREVANAIRNNRIGPYIVYSKRTALADAIESMLPGPAEAKGDDFIITPKLSQLAEEASEAFKRGEVFPLFPLECEGGGIGGTTANEADATLSVPAEAEPERAGDRELIACAALRFPDGTILAAPRHGGAMNGALKSRLGLQGDPEQGFLTNRFDRFVTRKEAHAIAQAAGQIRYRCGGDDGRLFSENLY